MNRLIIIGNGFDLAHGIKTSFNDFITDYFCSVVNSFFNNEIYSDPLIEITKKEFDFYFFHDPLRKPVDKTKVYTYLEHFKNSPDFTFKFNSRLLERIYSKCSKLLWVDIEIEYFNILLVTKHVYKNSNQVEAIKGVNNQLEFLKSRLLEYLKQQQLEFGSIKNNTDLLECFYEKIKADEVVTTNLVEDIHPDKLYFLNFNYTNTIESYVQLGRNRIESDVNYIHGDLKETNGKTIFGFGDELNKKYLEFEEEKNNELFKHIKSFEYLQTKNFYLLTRFLESNVFQVHIYGHSCGLSDRTLLSQIFEHQNCKSVKIFYHQIAENNTDFTDKTYEISRHFRDKTMLRKKLVPFDLSQSMPQSLP